MTRVGTGGSPSIADPEPIASPMKRQQKFCGTEAGANRKKILQVFTPNAAVSLLKANVHAFLSQPGKNRRHRREGIHSGRARKNAQTATASRLVPASAEESSTAFLRNSWHFVSKLMVYPFCMRSSLAAGSNNRTEDKFFAISGRPMLSVLPLRKAMVNLWPVFRTIAAF